MKIYPNTSETSRLTYYNTENQIIDIQHETSTIEHKMKTNDNASLGTRKISSGPKKIRYHSQS